MERIRWMNNVAAFAALLLAACTPMDTPSTETPLQFAPGADCSGHEGRMFLCAEGGTQICWPSGTASECTEMMCTLPSGLPVSSDVDGGECAHNEWEYCPAADNSVGFRVCQVSGEWNDCNSCGPIRRPDAGVPPDGSLPTACESDPDVVDMRTCTIGTGACAAYSIWQCVDDRKTCPVSPAEPESEGNAPDNVDNDCNGVVDDGISRSCFPFPAPATPGFGACLPGTMTYDPSTMTWGSCVGAVGPSGPEVPNNLVDEDCDGTILTTTPCGSEPLVGDPCGVGVGYCHRDGTWLCSPTATGSRLTCSATPRAPRVERGCNNIDDDCDGVVDGNSEACSAGRLRWASVGECRPGTRTCTAGVWGACVGEVLPATEVCGNDRDENCNGLNEPCVDCASEPTVGDACDVGLGECNNGGLVECTDGVVSCSAEPFPETEEVCDGLDNDCDDMTDEDIPDRPCGSVYDSGLAGRGICVAGTQTCTGGSWSTCTGEVGPETEICGNTVDEDCNGADLACGMPCASDPLLGTSDTVGRGVCNVPCTYACTPSGLACEPDITPPMPSAETCNGLDDNCSGVVDEALDGRALRQICYPFATGLPGVGRCRYGEQVCSGGSFGTCTDAIGPSPEVCDGEDNDCDGVRDEGCTSGFDAGTGMADAGAGAMDAGVDAGPTMFDAGAPMPPGSGVYVWLDDPSSAHWCPSGMSVEQWLWDNSGPDLEHFGPPVLTVPVSASGVNLNGSVINSTVNCRYGSTRYEIERSSVILSSTIGASASSIGAHVYVNGVEVPAFICWDSPTGSRDPNYKRIQFRASTTMTPSGCAPGTDA